MIFFKFRRKARAILGERDDEPAKLPAVKLNLDYALQRRRQLQEEITDRERILCRRFPLYRLWLKGNRCSDEELLLAAAENSGAFKSREWFAMYLAIARRDVWSEVAALLCEEEYDEHEFVASPAQNGGEAGQICKHCGLLLAP